MVAVVLTWAVLGLRGEETRSADRPMPAAEGVPTSAATRMTLREPSVDTGDYVVVDSVDGPSQLVVHTTRDPQGHDTTPYVVVISPNTIVHPDDDSSAQRVGTDTGLMPGDRFYFVGSILSAPPHRVVEATRIFVGI